MEYIVTASKLNKFILDWKCDQKRTLLSHSQLDIPADKEDIRVTVDFKTFDRFLLSNLRNALMGYYIP